MQLDKTRIAIRERGMLETFDLALHVLRVYAVPLVFTMAWGVLPLMLVNYLLIGWMWSDRDNALGFPGRFLWHLTVLVFLEMPLASIFATSYLGQAVFQERPRIAAVLREVIRLLPRIAWCHVFVRGVGLAWLLVLAVDRQADADPTLEIVLPILLLLYAGGLRAARPFINEIVLLEKNPLLSLDRQVMTIGRRSGLLHGVASGDLMGRAVGAVVMGVLLLAAIFGTIGFGAGVLLNDTVQEGWMLGLAFPAAMWLAALFLTVFRFLSYLDLRIRQEGWEVELKVRAEAARLTARMT